MFSTPMKILGMNTVHNNTLQVGLINLNQARPLTQIEIGRFYFERVNQTGKKNHHDILMGLHSLVALLLL